MILRDFASGSLVPTILGSLTTALGLALFIFAASPVSGGHLNPLITISTFVNGLATFPRAVLYVLFQTAGATTAGYLLHSAGIGRSLDGSSSIVIPGCTMDTLLVQPGEAFILETLSSLTLVFLAFGVGLDPRQKTVYGPALGPILIGLALGLCIFATGFSRDGYTGACMNPARCFGLIAPIGGEAWRRQWVHWAGGITAALVNAAFYWLIPPSKKRTM
jgi:glycerol uptake facilitator-like aquaporin